MSEAKEKLREMEKNEVLIRLNTLLPLELKCEFDEYAKEFSSNALGKYDYVVTIRKLLEAKDQMVMFANLFRQIEEINERIEALETKPEEEEDESIFGKNPTEEKI